MSKNPPPDRAAIGAYRIGRVVLGTLPGEFTTTMGRRIARSMRDAVLLPAGRAWQSVLGAHPEIGLYGPDQFHPTRAGAYLAALVIFGGLADRTTVGLTQHRPIDGLPDRTVSVLERAADEANRTYGRQ